MSKILIIEDEAAIRRVLTKILTEESDTYQVEDAEIAAREKRQVRREITRILTPGTLTDDGMLKGRKNNYLAAVVIAGDHWGLAYSDISTGEFLTAQGNAEYIDKLLQNFSPSEILIQKNNITKDRISEIRRGLFKANKMQLVIALVGRISRWKGQKLMLEAFEKFSKLP